MKQTFKISLILLLAINWSCTNENDQNQIENPATYTFERDGISTVSYTGQSERIAMAEELIDAMLNFDETTPHLLEMYANQTANGEDADPFADPTLNESTKSIKSKTAASKDFFSSNTAESAIIKAEFESWIEAQVSEVFPNENIVAEPGVAGQIADGSSVRYVNGKGLEYDQIFGKGLIGALMVDQMLNNYLSTSVLDEADNRTNNDAGITAEGKNYTTMEHKWDEAYGYLFGASSNAAEPTLNLGEDSFLNKYLARVNNDLDFAGIANDIWEAFKLGRAAIVAGEYDVRDEQAQTIRELVSKVVAIRAVYYLQQGKNGLPLAGNNYGPSFHDFSEGAGFIYSLRFLRKPNSNNPYFSKSEIDAFMDQLFIGNGFWEIEPSTLDEMSQAIANKFDFTVEMAGS